MVIDAILPKRSFVDVDAISDTEYSKEVLHDLWN